MTTARKTTDERKDLMARRITSIIAQGLRVESQGDFQAVLVRGHRVNHILHLIITLITFGFWGVVWIGLVVFGGEKRELVQVDEFGNVSVSHL